MSSSSLGAAAVAAPPDAIADDSVPSIKNGQNGEQKNRSPKSFTNLLGFFNLVPVGSFCAALKEKTSTWRNFM